jgi:predicted nucleic acid-binding protein
MNDGRRFFDTNVLLYLLGDDEEKASRAEDLLSHGGTVSVQVLNEMASVITRKMNLAWPETLDILSTVRSLCQVEPLTLETHQEGLRLANRYRLSVYDAMIVASALLAGCQTLVTEDLQDGLCVENGLTILNPFHRR